MSSTRKRPVVSFDSVQQTRQVVRPVQDRIAYEIELERIHSSPRNPRQKLDGIDELAESLQTYGLLQPVVVRAVNGSYELVAGHRRVAAARHLGWSQIAAVVRDSTDDHAYLLTLTENLQREDLTPKEEATALEVLVRERGWTTRQVGEAIKRSHIYVSRRLRVFEDPVLAPLVLDRKLPVSTAEELLRASDTKSRQDLAARAVDGEWSWSDARRAVSEIGTGRSKVAQLLAHLRCVVADAGQIDADALTPGERKQVRHARAALGRLL